MSALISRDLSDAHSPSAGRSGDFRALIDRIPDAVAVRQHERLVYVNSSFAALVGVAAEELIGVHISELVHPDDRDLVSSRTRTMGTAAQRTSVRFRHASGAYLALEVDPVRIVDFDGEPARLLIARDPSERQREQARLLLTERMASMGMVAAGVLHDINNPLAYVIANLEHALGQLDPSVVDADVLAALEQAREGAERVRHVARDLRLFSRGDDGGATEPTDVRTVIDSAVRIGWAEIRHRAHVVRDDVEVPRVVANSARLGQVFLNLLVNAAQAFPDGRAADATIRITTRVERNYVVVRIEDNGPGIPHDVVARLFEPFVTTKSPGVGTGLGLYLCRKIVESMDGRIRVASNGGNGAAFEVALPISDVESAKMPVAAPASRPNARRSLLIVDDEPAILTALDRSLRKLHDVTTCGTASAALDLIRAGERFDLVLCDLQMPNVNGIEFHEAVRAFDPSLAARIVFMTGGAFTAAASEFLTQVKNPRIEKPFEMSMLRQKLADWMSPARHAVPRPTPRR